MLTETDEDHYSPSVRQIELTKTSATHCGFNLTRGKWDPYPWVSSVDPGTAAHIAGMQAGDCLLEVNGEDVVGRRVSEVAEIVKSKPDQVSLLLWNAGADPQCTPEAICCGPMPTNLQRLSACMSTILAFLECPVCLDTIPPPTYQCDNGHLICIRCRAKSERCPVCRLKLTRGRSLLSDQIYHSVIEAFNLREEPDESRSAKMQQILKFKKTNKNVPEIKITPTTKLMTRIVGKSTSVENLMTEPQSRDFDTNLKTKSLSTNEIFQSESPGVSRSGSVSRLGRWDKSKLCPQQLMSSASCHGSFENLNNYNDCEEELFCPFALNCTTQVKTSELMQHFGDNHEGCLIHFYKPHLSTNLKKIMKHKNFCYSVTLEKCDFYIKIELDSKCEDILIWSWTTTNKKTIKDFDLAVKVSNSEDSTCILGVRNRVCSLNCTSYSELNNFKKAVFINVKTLLALNVLPKNIVLDITLIKNEFSDD